MRKYFEESIIVLFIISILISSLSSQEGAKNLKRDLFSSYDSQSRPVEDSSHIMNVCAGLYVLQVVGLNEKSQVKCSKCLNYFQKIKIFFFLIR